MKSTPKVSISPAVSIWKLDPAHSSAEFSAKHMMITTVRGRFADVKGTIWVDSRNPAESRVEAEMNAASIDTKVEQRDQHLRSAEFLDVDNHPVITFRSTRIEGLPEKRADLFKEGESFRLIGELTIRGTTIQVTLDCTYAGRGMDPWGGERIGFNAEATLDRRDWGLRWNQALETGGVLVSNQVKIEIEAQAVREGEDDD